MAATLTAIERQQMNLKRKILRAKETGDTKRLISIRVQLAEIREDLERMQEDCEPPKPAFRRSYALEAFMEGLIEGKKLKAHQASRRLSS
jgi:hypothetical protein